MLSRQNNDTLRKNIKGDANILYGHPYTIEEKEQFKDILDIENGILIPYVKNIRLPSIREYPIKIRNQYSVYIDYYNDGVRSRTKNIDKFCVATISDYNNSSTDTLKMYSEMKNRLKIKNCVY